VRYPHAIWKGANAANYSTNRITPRLVIIHVAQGSEAGIVPWFHNPAAQVSSHFFNPFAGPMLQFVDTNQEAYAEMAFNGEAISIEHEGFTGEHLNDHQLENLAVLLPWVRAHHGVTLKWRNDPYSGSGVTGHSNLGIAGGNHPHCPGLPIEADVRNLLNKLQRRLFVVSMARR
jgi:N-acetyl-anhydromuramyl-L-alanine amidase AmpD